MYFVHSENITIVMQNVCNHLVETDDSSMDMLGLIDTDVHMTKRLSMQFGYVTLNALCDTAFFKKMYKYMINAGSISGRQVCMLLYEQGVLDMNADDSKYQSLASGSMGAYEFMSYVISNKIITVGQLALKPCSGSAVVTNPDNGDVLALVSYPSYDNNKLSGTVDAKYYSSLVNDNASPLLNRATQSFIAPGSTYKPCTIIAGIDSGIISSSTTFNCSGVFDKVTPSPRCWQKWGHGSETPVTAIRDSCNVYMYNVGYNLACSKNGSYNSTYGTNILKKYSDMLGLSTKTGIEIEEGTPGASSQNAIASAIGQGNHRYSTLNLARYVTTLATSGTCYNLTLIDKITDYDGNVIKETDALGNNSQTHYNAFGLVEKEVDKRGFAVSYVYNDKFQLTEMTDKLGNKATFEYNDQGFVSKATNQNGFVSEYEYYIYGQKIKDTYPNKNVTEN